MKTALTRLGLKQRREEGERGSAPIWHSGTKGDGTAPEVKAVRYFSFEELKQCTDNFSEKNLLGIGGFGKVYIGDCTTGAVVAIKRRHSDTLQGLPEFQCEIEVLSRVHHKNIVRLVGFCCEQGEQLLVYEYLSKGTLRWNLLCGKDGVYLDWGKRLQIALDAARGLAYLHELANPLIIHRDVKSTNILLDENLNAKVTDFGLSKMVSEKEKLHVSSQVSRILARVDSVVKGSIGYLDPEYFRTQQLTEKSDVYSFGVVMLELITARYPIDQTRDRNNINLVEAVMTAIDENDEEYYGLRDVIDPKIVNQLRNVEFRKFVQLALRCLKDSGSDRPSMSEIMKEIDIILQMNGARYFSFEELKRCTNKFSEKEKIGAGGIGEVYKGYCTNGVVLAIKRRCSDSQQGTLEFRNEIEVLSRVHHKNIVNLVGFCCEQGEQLLVYKYMSKGTLRDNLYGKGGVYLDWQKRLQIALDSARGLAYLHELANPLIIHRDVNSKNILLDDNLNAKFTGFGLSKMVSEWEKLHVSSEGIGTLARVESMVKGTFGYLDPEYFKTQILTEKSDVYGFGVVMLELITARPVIDPTRDRNNINLVEAVTRATDENDQVYYGLRGMIDTKIVNQVRNVDFRKFAQLALQCLNEYGSDRPSMSEIMKEIDIILQQLEVKEQQPLISSGTLNMTTIQ